MSWQQACYDAGGFPTVFPPQANGPTGEPACRFRNSDGSLRYEEADEGFLEQLKRKAEIAGDQVDIALGDLVDKRDQVLEATRGAVPGVLGYALGIPPWAVLLIAGYVGYRFLESYLPRGS